MHPDSAHGRALVEANDRLEVGVFPATNALLPATRAIASHLIAAIIAGMLGSSATCASRVRVRLNMALVACPVGLPVSDVPREMLV